MLNGRRRKQMRILTIPTSMQLLTSNMGTRQRMRRMGMQTAPRTGRALSPTHTSSHTCRVSNTASTMVMALMATTMIPTRVASFSSLLSPLWTQGRSQGRSMRVSQCSWRRSTVSQRGPSCSHQCLRRLRPRLQAHYQTVLLQRLVVQRGRRCSGALSRCQACSKRNRLDSRKVDTHTGMMLGTSLLLSSSTSIVLAR